MALTTISTPTYLPWSTMAPSLMTTTGEWLIGQVDLLNGLHSFSLFTVMPSICVPFLILLFRDGTHTMLGGCEVKFRNMQHETWIAIRYRPPHWARLLTMKLDVMNLEFIQCIFLHSMLGRYENDRLTVSHDLANKRAWAPCVSIGK